MDHNSANMLASVGVLILLIAFFLQLTKVLSSESKMYLALNFIGGAIAALSSYFLGVMAFVILEGTWSFMALFLLLKTKS